jgi:hypothetical protein
MRLRHGRLSIEPPPQGVVMVIRERQECPPQWIARVWSGTAGTGKQRSASGGDDGSGAGWPGKQRLGRPGSGMVRRGAARIGQLGLAKDGRGTVR